MSNLDSFIKSSRPPPQCLATSQDIRDRGSVFTANIFRATSPVDARTCINHVKHVVHAPKSSSRGPASHEITAWRCMALKLGRTGLAGEDDFELTTGSEDDGEKWAGSKVLKVVILVHTLRELRITSSRIGDATRGDH